ncbi:hypothetical protein RRG08_032556 [Elysia crispata]|uniref:Uncharacterized protein n=1 Tax=Elysia crispata TaxID=231223 RepID=A0AAE0ZY60_9GAST|nr:hypothetical protein RRG08_032556 [Elysia crispata]
MMEGDIQGIHHHAGDSRRALQTESSESKHGVRLKQRKESRGSLGLESGLAPFIQGSLDQQTVNQNRHEEFPGQTESRENGNINLLTPSAAGSTNGPL